MYNTTQLILVNGHGYTRFIETFLKPFFESKISLHTQEIKEYNQKALEILGPKQVKRSTVKYKSGVPFDCKTCGFSAKSLVALKKHKVNEHVLSSPDTSNTQLKPIQQSTRNNSMTEALMQENISSTNLSDSENISIEENMIKYTCLECKFVTTEKKELQKHVINEHGCTGMDFECKTCGFVLDSEKQYNSHVQTHHVELKSISNDKETNSIFKCERCNFECHDMDQLGVHNTKHASDEMKLEVNLITEHKKENDVETDESNTLKKVDQFICNGCDYNFLTLLELEWHEVTDHGDLPPDNKIVMNVSVQVETPGKNSEIDEPRASNVNCPVCKLETKNQDTLKKHIENIHKDKPSETSNESRVSIIETDLSTKCEKCKFIGSNCEVNKHINSKHGPVESVLCEVCDQVFPSGSFLQNHIQAVHTKKEEKCGYCENSFKSREDLRSHMEEAHEEIVVLCTMAQQVNSLSDMFRMILEKQDIMGQELVSLRNILDSNTFNAQKKEMRDQEEDRKVFVNDEIKETYASKAAIKPGPAQPPSACQVPPPSPKPKEQRKRKSKYLEKSKVLFIGDSVAHRPDFASMEQKLNCRIRTRKAYSSVYDSVARFPQKNINDVTKRALIETPEDDHFKYLVLAAPTVDITNINVEHVEPNEDVEIYKQKVEESCQNVFNVAENAILDNPQLEKVVVLEHAPRYDMRNVDPVGIKPKLANHANNTLTHLWNRSSMKNKIVIGRHSLDSDGDQIDNMYRDSKSGRYDGVHFYGHQGRTMYTRSMLRIMESIITYPRKTMQSSTFSYNNHTTCPQALYQERQWQKHMNSQGRNQYDHIYSVPVKNKFASLGN